MTKSYDPNNRAEVLAALRHEILAARLRVTVDRKLGNETSELVKYLASLKLPY